MPSVTFTLYAPFAVTTRVEAVSPPITTLSLYQTYEGEEASELAVKVVVTQTVKFPVIAAVGKGLIVTVEGAEVRLHVVVPSVTLTLYGPPAVTTRVDEVSPLIIE